VEKETLTYDQLLEKYNQLQEQELNSITTRHELAKAKSSLDDELAKFQVMQKYGQVLINVSDILTFSKLTLDYFIEIYNQARGCILEYNNEYNCLETLSVFGIYDQVIPETIELTHDLPERIDQNCFILSNQKNKWDWLSDIGFYDAYICAFLNEDEDIQGLVIIGHNAQESSYYPSLTESDIPSFSTLTQTVGTLFSNLHYQQRLTKEIDERKSIHQALFESQEALRLANQDLENRILHRTKELKSSNLKLKDQASALIQINDDLRRFTSIVSHDLKTPLRSIGSFAGLLKKKISYKLDDSEAHYLSIIENGAISMYELIEDLLTYTKVNSENLSVIKTEIKSLVNELLVLFRTDVNETNAVIINNVEEDIILCDRTKLKQVFSNLIQNSLKFSNVDGKSPRITITSECSGKHWKYSVNDNGIGISPKFKQKVFTEFQRLNGNKYQGTGMGLSICKRIIDKHGGTIWFDSDENGTTFHFTILKQTEDMDSNSYINQASY